MEHLIVPLLFLGIVIWSVLMQRRAVLRQKQSMETQREAVERQKEAMIESAESLKLIRKQVDNQEKIIALLEQIRDGRTS